MDMNEKIIGDTTYVFEKRNSEQNQKFIGFLEKAEDAICQAINNVRYNTFPEMNKELFSNLENISEDISKIIYKIAKGDCVILNPVIKKPSELKYYELQYFRGRKDTGSIYVKSEVDVKDYDEDAFLLELVNRGELDISEVNDIVKVLKTNEITYKCMANHNKV